MSKIQKSNMTVNGNHVQLSMPFAKVNQEMRTVTGYATLDNIDSQGDIVLAEASAKAFSRARGNLREMHQPIAVGKVVDFREDEYFDATSGKLYRGIFVTARVSEGAEDTWKKVLDGTLTGFSIGGDINDASSEFVKEAGRTVRFIKDYDLTELSLVDNPANQLANVFSIQKSATTGSVTVTGMVADTQIENVFICKTDDTVLVKEVESIDCPECGVRMENAGWFEEGPNRAEKVKEIVSKFLSPTEKEAAPENAESEGGVEMGTEDKVEKSEAAAEDVVETAGTEEVSEPVDPPAETVDEVVDDASKIEKKLDELKETINESLEKSREATDARVSELETRIDTLSKNLDEMTSGLDKKFDEYGEKLEAAKNSLAEFEKVLDTVNSSEAVKKSADLDDEAVETVQKSRTGIWNGAFSVNNLLD